MSPSYPNGIVPMVKRQCSQSDILQFPDLKPVCPSKSKMECKSEKYNLKTKKYFKLMKQMRLIEKLIFSTDHVISEQNR